MIRRHLLRQATRLTLTTSDSESIVSGKSVARRGCAFFVFVCLGLMLLTSVTTLGDLPYSFRRFVEHALVSLVLVCLLLSRSRDATVDRVGLLLLVPGVFYVACGFSSTIDSWSADLLLTGLCWLLLAALVSLDFSISVDALRRGALFLLANLMIGGLLTLFFSQQVEAFGRFFVGGLEAQLGGNWAGFSHANLYASFLATNLVILLGTLDPCARQKLAKDVSQPVAIYILMVLGGAIIYASGSKTGSLGCLMGVACMAIYSRRNSRYLVGLAVGVGASVLVGMLISELSGAGRDSFARIANMARADGSTLWRIDALYLGILAWIDSPWIGHGFNGWQTAIQKVFLSNEFVEPFALDFFKAGHPHNYVISILVELGLVGLLFVLAPVCVWGVICIYRARPHALLVVAPIMPIGLHLMTEFPDRISGVHLPLMVFIFALWSRQLSEIPTDRAQNLSLVVRASVVTIAVVLLVVFSRLAVDVIRFDSVRYRILLQPEISASTFRELSQHRLNSHWLFGSHYRRILLMQAIPELARNPSLPAQSLNATVERAIAQKPSEQAWRAAMVYFRSTDGPHELYNAANFARLKNQN